MRPVILISIFIGSIQFLSAQDIQLKKGMILRDKQPVAKIEGKATLLKGTNIDVTSLTDEPLINIKVTYVNLNSNFTPRLYYTTLTFPSLSLAVQRLDMHQLTSEKKIVELLFEKIGSDFLTSTGLNSDLVKAYAAANDEALKLQKDSVFFKSFVTMSKERLASSTVKRNLEAPISFKGFSEDGELIWKGYEKDFKPGYSSKTIQSIYQDGKMIGIIVTILQKSYSSPDYSEAFYYVLKKVQPFTVDDQSFEYIPLARLTTNAGLLTSMTVENQGIIMQVPKVNDFTRAEGVFVNALLKDGYLK